MVEASLCYLNVAYLQCCKSAAASATAAAAAAAGTAAAAEKRSRRRDRRRSRQLLVLTFRWQVQYVTPVQEQLVSLGQVLVLV
jgi:hypothetical protein